MKQEVILKQAIRSLAASQKKLKKKRPCLPEQPFDSLLLDLSSLFRRSRTLYLDQGGQFLSTLVSTPRNLSSTLLLDQLIEYSPIERELIWTATDPKESKNLQRLLTLRTYSSSLFH